MKSGTLLMMAVVFNLGVTSLGVARADALQPGPGFDRVGRVDVNGSHPAAKPGARPTRVSTAPDGGGVADYPARKREVTRRLLWLMLSAR